MIIDINNNKVKNEDAVERLNKSISELNQPKQKQSTALRNKMVQVAYQFFNSFGFNNEIEPLFNEKESEQTEEKMRIPLFSKKELEQTEEKLQIPLWFRINNSDFDELTSDIYNNQNNKDFRITKKKNLWFKKYSQVLDKSNYK